MKNKWDRFYPSQVCLLWPRWLQLVSGLCGAKSYLNLFVFCEKSFLFLLSCQLKQRHLPILSGWELGGHRQLACILPSIHTRLNFLNLKPNLKFSFVSLINPFTLALTIFKTRSSPCPGSHSSSPGLLLLRGVQPRRWAFNLSFYLGSWALLLYNFDSAGESKQPWPMWQNLP